MSKVKGFSKFICKIEGKEPIVPKSVVYLSEADYYLPRSYDYEYLLNLIDEVIATGEHNYIAHTNFVDMAFTWDTHSMEDEWRAFCGEGFVTQRIYNVCLSWIEQLEGYSDCGDEEDDFDIEAPW